MDKKVSQIIDDICTKGWAVFPEFFSSSFTMPLKDVLLNKHKTPASIGDSKVKNSEIRSDNIYWLSSKDNDSGILKFNQSIEEIRTQLNLELMLGLNSFDSHFAEYPEGSFYKAHIDATKKNNTRVLTFITYLNENWKSENGGQLRIHNNNSFVDIEPHMGTVVCFRSETVLHEVLPAKKQRCAITGWFHNSSTRNLI